MTKWICGCVTLLLTATAASAQPPALPLLPAPAQGEFVIDSAGLLAPEDQLYIRSTARSLLTEKGTLLLAVTITSLADHRAADRSIAAFAQSLLATWRQGDLWALGPVWKHAILVLVSRDDRQVRIELAPAWAHQKDTACRKILDDSVLPALRRDDYSTGIRAGVTALDRLVRTASRDEAALPLPSPSAPSPHHLSQPAPENEWLIVLGPGIVLVIAVVFIIIQHNKRPRDGGWPLSSSACQGAKPSGGGLWPLSNGMTGGSYQGGWSGGGSSGGSYGGDGGCSGGGATGSF